MKSSIRITAICLFVLNLPVLSYGELSAESYFQVAVGIAQQQVDYLTKLTPLIEKYGEDPNFWPVYATEPNSFLDEKASPRKTLDDQRAALIGSHNTTVEELYIFEENNQEAIAEYLVNNPEVEQAISTLSVEITALTSKIKVPYYCLAVVANIKLEIKNASELVALAQQYYDDTDSFLEQEQAIRKKHNAAKEALFKSFDRTTNEYLTFMSKNKEVVEQYLTNHPLIRDTINDLSSVVGPLIEEFEALREDIVSEPDLPPVLE